MKHVNITILMGNVGNDPKMGNGVARFRLATNRKWRDKEGNQKESTTWTTCVAFGKLSEIVERYVKRGSPVHIVGYAESREYEKDGQKREAYEIIVEDLSLLPSSNESGSSQDRGDSRNQPSSNNQRSSGGGQQSDRQQSNQRPSNNQQSNQQSNSQPSQAPQQGGGGNADDFDDYPL